MRVISVKEESSSSHLVLWGLSGAALGIAAGVLLSEKLSGRAGGARTLWRRARSLAKVAGAQWLPWLELALELKGQWLDSDSVDDEDEEDDDSDNGLNAEDTEEGDDGDNGDPDDDVPDVIGARVLEAFLNDPVLSERAVEIQADADGAVLLHGRVLTAREVSHAVTIAGGVPGVTDVRQRLRVRHRR